MNRIDNELDKNYLYDDDKYISDCKSKKRRLLISEKIYVILVSLFSFPIGFLLTCYITNEGKEFLTNPTGPFLLSFFLVWAFSFLLQILIIFSLKNFSLYKGFLKTIIVNASISVAINLSLTGLTLSDLFIKAGLFSSAFYVIVIALLIMIILIRDKNDPRIICVVGPKEEAISLAREIISKKKKNVKVRYVFYEINGEVDDKIYEKFTNVNEIILLDSLKFNTKQKLLFYFNSSLNKDIYVCASCYDIVSYSPSIKSIEGRLAIEQKPFTIDVVERAVKRIFDLLCSFILLVLSLPVWIIVPILIKLDSKGPVFFRQERYTTNLKPFNILKFRSMYVDADPDKLNTVGDKRVTRVGKIIRATRIDEIPQILNVFKGDMSFVGPRPFMHSVVAEHLKNNFNFRYRFNVKAGITGLQQVKTSPGVDYDEKLKYDLYYIAHYSLFLDIKIMLDTFITVLNKSMSEGIKEEKTDFITFLKENHKEFNEHETYIRIINHKRYIDDKTGFIIPLENLEDKQSKKEVDFYNKEIKK